MHKKHMKLHRECYSESMTLGRTFPWHPGVFCANVPKDEWSDLCGPCSLQAMAIEPEPSRKPSGHVFPKILKLMDSEVRKFKGYHWTIYRHIRYHIMCFCIGGLLMYNAWFSWGFPVHGLWLPSGNLTELLNMAIEIVSFPIKKWWFSIVMLVYQRVSPVYTGQ